MGWTPVVIGQGPGRGARACSSWVILEELRGETARHMEAGLGAEPRTCVSSSTTPAGHTGREGEAGWRQRATDRNWAQPAQQRAQEEEPGDSVPRSFL